MASSSDVDRFQAIVVDTITEFLSDEDYIRPHFNVREVLGVHMLAIQSDTVDKDEVAAEISHKVLWHYKPTLRIVTRYKLLTILFPICRKFVQASYNVYHTCKACGNTGWWCRGCGGYDKQQTMEDVGILNSHEVYKYQFAGCDQPLVPCFVCNREGDRYPDDDCLEIDPEFWETFLQE
jgi:hypothetical protein